jgi:hypothetical protein
MFKATCFFCSNTYNIFLFTQGPISPTLSDEMTTARATKNLSDQGRFVCVLQTGAIVAVLCIEIMAMP